MKTKFFSFLALTMAVGFAACNNDSDSTAESDTASTTNTENTTAATNTNTSDYAAMADSFRVNSEAGNYLDPRTGKKIKIGIDPQSGTRYNVETNEPVWRYVDRRNWWVYGGDDWSQVGEARMEGNELRYKGDNDTWVNYEDRWRVDDTKRSEDFKKKYGDTKVKISKDGDIKVKDENGKVKYDAEDNKIKTDSSK